MRVRQLHSKFRSTLHVTLQVGTGAVRRATSLLAATALVFAATQGTALASPQTSLRTPAAPGGIEEANTSAAQKRGRSIFAQHCSFCHGADARGAGVGPDLTQAPIVNHDQGTGNVLAMFLKHGKPNFGMPAFPDLPGDQIHAIAQFLRVQILAAARAPKLSILVGNPQAGARYFGAHCTSCHSVSGDLRGIGRRLDPMTLQARIVNPRARGSLTAPAPQNVPVTVTVTPHNAAPVSGELLSETDFYITLKTRLGGRRTFLRNGDEPSVQVHDPLQAHMKLMRSISDSDLHAVTAYLESVK